MAKFSKKTLEFLNDIGGDAKKLLTPIPTSADRMIPGNVLIFKYRPLEGGFWKRLFGDAENQRIILIVKCKRGDGVFPGKTDKLVSCFKLEASSESVVETILDNLYKKRRRASYYGLIRDSLITILGKNSFRTYRLQGMDDIHLLSLGTQRVRFD